MKDILIDGQVAYYKCAAWVYWRLSIICERVVDYLEVSKWLSMNKLISRDIKSAMNSF